MRAQWPNLFIVGAPRCGTSSLFAYLAAHPDVCGASEKEPHYYDRDLLGPGGPTRDEYAALFAGASTERWLLEASALYLYSHEAPAAILRDSPGAHVVVSLRDPVELVASWHQLLVASGAQTIVDLVDAIDAGTAPLLPYAGIGAFAAHVARWRRAFGEERVHLLRLETLDESSLRLVRTLGLEPLAGAEMPHLNPARRAAGVATMINRASPLRSAASALLPRPVRRSLWQRVNRALTPPAERAPVADEVRRRLEPLFVDELELLQTIP